MDTTDQLVEKIFTECEDLRAKEELGVLSPLINEKVRAFYSLYKNYIKDLSFEEFLRKVRQKILEKSAKGTQYQYTD
ncbi:MAG: hypothetical protein QG669_356 [Patescibacteria group bacterium]|jgi:hypothetical protein|nr:hypothetical protein [Patescibacteria group bacterium]MDQ5961964.1 hypothetical protein [Patescibacteria group bacterium]